MVSHEGRYGKSMSLSLRRAWIEISGFLTVLPAVVVALLTESVD